jgi:hypothetical protein
MSKKEPIEKIISQKFKSLNLYKDQNSNLYIISKGNLVYINRDEFSDFSNSVALSVGNTVLRADQVAYLRSYMKARAYSEKIKQVDVSIRVMRKGRSIYYDLCTPDKKIAKITKEGVKITNSVRAPFIRNNLVKSQVIPNLNIEAKQLRPLLKKHFNIKRATDLNIVIVVIVSYFIEGIQHPILCHIGEKGSGKSSSMKNVKAIVDPSPVSLQSLPRTVRDLAVILSQSYFTCFDNIEKISADISNVLSQAITGGHFLTRALFTNDGLAIMNLLRCVSLNGTSEIIKKSDLADRSFVIEFERMNSKKRITEQQLSSNLSKDLPDILGAIFNCLYEVLKIIDNIKPAGILRLLDFELWGIAIAEVIGIGRDDFLSAIEENKDNASKRLLMAEPVAVAILTLMNDKPEWVGSVTALLTELRKVAIKHPDDINSRLLPSVANQLSRKVTDLKSNLQDSGIDIYRKNIGPHKQIEIVNKNFEIK